MGQIWAKSDGASQTWGEKDLPPEGREKGPFQPPPSGLVPGLWWTLPEGEQWRAAGALTEDGAC